MERLHNIIERAEIVEMIGIDICDDADGGVELQERIDIFTRFANNIRTFADSAVAVDERKLAADDGARVTSGFNQDLREHTGRRRFAVRAGNRNRVCKLLRQKAEHHGTLQRRNTLCTRRNKLRVILLCSRRVHHDLRIADVLRAVTHVHRDAVAANARERVGFIDVAAGDDIILVV